MPDSVQRVCEGARERKAESRGAERRRGVDLALRTCSAGPALQHRAWRSGLYATISWNRPCRICVQRDAGWNGDTVKACLGCWPAAGLAQVWRMLASASPLA